MRYEATAVAVVNGEHCAAVEAVVRAPEALAARHARAMKSVLLAAKAWHAQMVAGYGTYTPADDTVCTQLSLSCERLAKVEKEVPRG